MDKSRVSKNKAIFLDRDGTINEEMGYINHADRFKVFDFVPESIRIFKSLGFKVIIVTNQSGVARGYFSESLLKEIHHNFLETMERQGAAPDDIYYCPHHPSEGNPPYRQECDCRKPKPGMVLSAAEKWHLDLSNSFLVGDRYKDILFAKKLGIGAALVMTGYGQGEFTYQRKEWAYIPDFIGENLLDIAKQIEQFLSKRASVDKKV